MLTPWTLKWNNGIWSSPAASQNTRIRRLHVDEQITVLPLQGRRPNFTIQNGAIHRQGTHSRISAQHIIRGTFTRIDLGDVIAEYGVSSLPLGTRVPVQGWVQTPENMGFGDASAVTSISSRMASGVLRHVLHGPNLGNVSGTEQEWVLNTTAQIRAYIVFT